jgi:hypothetical protein
LLPTVNFLKHDFLRKYDTLKSVDQNGRTESENKKNQIKFQNEVKSSW